ncbi:MAG: HEPN domain-containing protein [Proteobacteria bacterium]|nr:HEPN domain-containing protein [Pseudomonadota bacterium]
MSPQRTQKYKTEYAYALLRIAQGDLESAQALYAAKTGRKENVGYLAQQCVEKCLKAVLCYKGVPVPHTNELAALLPLMDSSWLCPYGLEISDLSYFATVRRYMEGSYEIENEELEATIEVATKILEWTQEIVA